MSLKEAFTEYAPTRGVALILCASLLAWGLWVLLPFEAFANPAFALMVSIASEPMWGMAFAFAGLSLGRGIVKKDVALVRTGALLGFFLWMLIAVMGGIAEPAATGMITRSTIALMHAWVYVQAKVHPELLTGTVKVSDLKVYVEAIKAEDTSTNYGGKHNGRRS